MTNTQYYDVAQACHNPHVLIHSIFSTKNREPLLCEKELRQRIHAYLAEVLQSLQCPALIVGGVADHVHVLYRIAFDERYVWD